MILRDKTGFFFLLGGGGGGGGEVHGCLMQQQQQQNDKQYHAYACEILSLMLGQTFSFRFSFSHLFYHFSFHPLFICHVSKRFIFIVCVCVFLCMCGVWMDECERPKLGDANFEKNSSV